MMQPDHGQPLGQVSTFLIIFPLIRHSKIAERQPRGLPFTSKGKVRREELALDSCASPRFDSTAMGALSFGGCGSCGWRSESYHLGGVGVMEETGVSEFKSLLGLFLVV